MVMGADYGFDDHVSRKPRPFLTRWDKGMLAAGVAILSIPTGVGLYNSHKSEPCEATIQYGNGSSAQRINGPHDQLFMGRAIMQGDTATVWIGEGINPSDFTASFPTSELPKYTEYLIDGHNKMGITFTPEDVLTRCIKSGK